MRSFDDGNYDDDDSHNDFDRPQWMKSNLWTKFFTRTRTHNGHSAKMSMNDVSQARESNVKPIFSEEERNDYKKNL